MLKKRKYIFLPYGISDVGGAELYILNKIHWLEKHGWETHVISSSCTEGDYKIKELDRFRKENFNVLTYCPHECTSATVDNILNKLIYIIGVNCSEETIIESHTGPGSLWGELLAHKLKCKHIIALINEDYSNVAYSTMKDFFWYKFKRKELIGAEFALHKIFDGYIEFSKEDIRMFKINEDPVQNVDDSRLSKIEKCDYTICYIGRTAKSYVPNIIEGVSKFAKNHQSKSIQFVIVGNAECRKSLLETKFKDAKNVKIIELGDVLPIPRKVFSLLDVVVAGSGSARCATYEGVPTIVADPFNNMANGVLGYDTIKSVGRDENVQQTTFDEALENVLIRKTYKKKKYIMPPESTVEDACKQNMDLVMSSSRDKDYYEIAKINNVRVATNKKIKSTIAWYCPFIFRKLINFMNKRKLQNSPF